MIELLTDIVLITTGFLLIVLSIALLSRRTKDSRSRNLLAAFLLTKAVLIIRWSSFRYGLFGYTGSPYLYTVSMSIFFLLAPLLYLYIKSICYKSFMLKPRDAIHIVPFVIFMLFSVFDVYVLTSEPGSVSETLKQFLTVHDENIFWGSNFVQILFYIIIILRMLSAYRADIINRYSTIEKIDLKWVSSLILLLFLHWVFIVSRGTLSILGVDAPNLIKAIDLFSITIFLVFVTYLVFKGLSQLKIDTGIYERGRNRGGRLPQFEVQNLAQEVMSHMKSCRSFLKPSLTIDDLSEELSVPPWQLSQTINDFYSQNFFNFVNSFRIEEAKRMLWENNNGSKTILEILYEVGFNSKSTFNSVFKNHTGMTPTEFKKTQGN